MNRSTLEVSTIAKEVINIQPLKERAILVGVEVKGRISSLGPTGLILGPTHAMQPDVSVDNIFSLYRTALKYGWNPSRL
jgi:hypothetical protein